MVIKTSTVFKVILFVVAMFMLEYFNMFFPSISVSVSRITLGSTAILLALITLLFSANNPTMKHQLRFANLFFMLYIPVVLVSAVLSFVWYKYSFSSILPVCAPFFYPLYAYPLIYIFSWDNTYEKYLKKIVALVLIMLALKAFSWYMYNYRGTVFFSNLLFKHDEGWVRNGMLRVDTGALYGIALCYLLFIFFARKKHRGALLAGGMILFAVFITQYRYLEIVIILVGLIIYLTSSVSDKKKLIRILILSALVLVFIAVGGLDAILSSFSVDNSETGSSTSARIETIDFFWSLMNGTRFFFGFGYLSTYSTTAVELITRSATEVYWLEDIGILGGFYMFGLMSLLIYLPLFYRSVKACAVSVKNKCSDKAFLSAIVGYMLISCIMLNIFDRQRVFDTAFYISLISFISANDELSIQNDLSQRRSLLPPSS